MLSTFNGKRERMQLYVWDEKEIIFFNYATTALRASLKEEAA